MKVKLLKTNKLKRTTDRATLVFQGVSLRNDEFLLKNQNGRNKLTEKWFIYVTDIFDLKNVEKKFEVNNIANGINNVQ